MAEPRFSIGIDLGTTNSALAFVAIAGEATSTVLPIRQWEGLSTVAEETGLPSFLYLPEAAVAQQLGGIAWLVGRLARRRARELPGRVVHSAKSWLCHHGSDREAAFLPWGSDDLSPSEKISPVRASALILAQLRAAWNDRFAADGAPFDAQDITVTVPASFDAAAQRLTLTAARDAGFPEGLRLLEEPQATFYRWLEQREGSSDAAGLGFGEALRHALVVDVGGGTTDFSLFEIAPDGGGAAPKIKRLAVGDHILLGGDNIDLALAHVLERRLLPTGGKLPPATWDTLVAGCRDLKERALAAEGAPDESFSVAVPGRGAGLVASALSASLTRAEIEAVLLEGFFPECAADVRVRRSTTAIREWGLPFATDTAVTRHLAAFLRGRPRVDAVLFNGGSLYPKLLRRRICDEIGKWQGGPAPAALENSDPDLAVARGAARFGKLLRQRRERIEAGSARAIFLETLGASGGGGSRPSLVCILPRGAAAEETFEVADLSLELRLDRPVRFQTYSSTRHGRSRPGDVVALDGGDLHPLPPLQTIARLEGATVPAGGEGGGGGTLPVTLTAKLSELGLLQVTCHSADPRIRKAWPLDFDLRPLQRGDLGPATGALPAAPNASPESIDAARRRIHAAFAPQPEPSRGKLPKADAGKPTAARLLAGLEKDLGVGKGDWNWVLVRSLWSGLDAGAPGRGRSIEHEETWLQLAGFLLRPGFGADDDESRIDSLWRGVHEQGLRFAGKRVKLQEDILWRRVAGGLSRSRQEMLLAREAHRLQGAKAPELVRMVGALERLGPETKADLAGRFVDEAARLAREGKHCTPWLAALGLILNRSPLYAGPESVLPPALVERAWEAFSGFDWSGELGELQMLFLRAARVVDDRSLDLPQGLRNRIAGKLETSGVPASRTARVRAFVPVAASERLGLFGESLPPGLILAGR